MGTQLLDCTLRDGGYVNDWRFGKSSIICILERLIQANVDIIEVGFLDEREPFNQDRTIQPDTDSYNKILSGIDRKKSMLVAMIDYGTCGLERISPREESVLDGIRVIFKRPKMREAVQFGRELTELGYKVFLQLVSITSYSDRDLLDFVDMANEFPPYAVSMVDTYGLMHKEEMLHYFHLLDYNLNPKIRIGYHSHNNFQLAYANTCELIKRKTKHDILVDGTLYGMGKSAGNAPLELLAMYLNENRGAAYDLSQLLEAIDTNILRIYYQKHWGYNLLYFLAASNDCHPNYIDYLLNKKTLSVGAINEIVKLIPTEKKLNYHQNCIEGLYIKYQKKQTIGKRSLQKLHSALLARPLLLLAPGKSLHSSRENIDAYIKNMHPIVVSVNFIPNIFPVNSVFISNAKRYTMLLPELNQLNERITVIATSNITAVGRPFDYVLNYADLIDENHLIEDNALILLLKALVSCQPSHVALAGFDGFGKQINESYYDDYMELSTNYSRLSQVNKALAQKLPEFKQRMELEFLTPSLYEET